MGVGLDLFGGLVCVTSVEKDKFPTENVPEIKGSHREISGGKYTTERKETSSCPKRTGGIGSGKNDWCTESGGRHLSFFGVRI